jgi:hypothetical protein
LAISKTWWILHHLRRIMIRVTTRDVVAATSRFVVVFGVGNTDIFAGDGRYSSCIGAFKARA